MGGSDYTDYVRDESGKPVAAFVVLDELVLSKTANAWATWKEQSPFVDQARPGKLDVVIEELAHDNVKPAFQYLALHELGHVFSVLPGIYPWWGRCPHQSEPDPAGYPFSKLSLAKKGREVESLFDGAFLLRSKLAFYKGTLSAKLDEVYLALEATNFPTLCAATNPYDDFADVGSLEGVYQPRVANQDKDQKVGLFKCDLCSLP